jgi:ribosomal protein L11 methyltransferase
MSNWTDVQLRVPAADVDRAADIAGMVAPYGIYIEDYSDLEQAAWQIAHIDLIDEQLVAKDRTEAIIHLYVAADENPQEAVAYISGGLQRAGINCSVTLSGISEEDWANNWRRYFKPTEIGQRLTICPSWEQYDNSAGRTVLTIDPGAAFGTGTHDTTRLCLQALDGLVQGGESLLDVGCGSGILAVAGVLLGCKNAVGVDIDPIAASVAAENAALNGVSDRTQFVCGDLTDKISGTYDLICANIVADVIIRLCDTIGQFMHAGTRLLCSGIIDTREQDVLDALAAHGLRVESRLVSGGWVALVVTAA